MYNTLDDLKILCGKTPDAMGMDDNNLLSTGKTEWTTILEIASEFAAGKILGWGYASAPVERLKTAEVFLVKAFLVNEDYSKKMNDVISVDLVGVQKITNRVMKLEDLNSAVKSLMEMAYSILSESANDGYRDFILTV